MLKGRVAAGPLPATERDPHDTTPGGDRILWSNRSNSSNLHTVNQSTDDPDITSTSPQVPDMGQTVGVPQCQVCGAAAGKAVYRFRQRLPWARAATEQVVRGCPECGFLFMSPRPGRAALAAYYAGDSHGSGQVFREEGSGSRAGQNAQMRAGFTAGMLQPGAEVLDIGCGQGLVLEALRGLGMTGFGLEPSPSAAASAAARGLTVVHGRLGTALDRQFDAVVMISVLEHLWDPAEGIAAALDYLKPGGLMMIEVPNALCPTPSLTDWFSFEHLSHFSPATLARLMRRFGFRWAALGSSFREGGVRLAAVAGADFPVRPGRWEALDEIEARCPVPALDYSAYPARQAALVNGVTDRVTGLFRRWQADGRRVAIYGAGLHSLQLAELVSLQDNAVCFLDGDPRKHGTQFCGLPVHAPEALPGLEIGAVLLSTAAFAEEMLARVRGLAGSGIAIADCYGRS